MRHVWFAQCVINRDGKEPIIFGDRLFKSKRDALEYLELARIDTGCETMIKYMRIYQRKLK